MKDYVKTKAIIAEVCGQSGLAPEALAGLLSECLAEVRQTMLTQMVAENMRLQEQMKEADDSGT